MSVKTHVFTLAPHYGYATDRELAEAMGVTPFMVSRVKAGVQKITATFIEGARRAFPDRSLDELFIIDDEAESEIAIA